MSYLSAEELQKIGFKYLGKNVLISDKCSIYNPEKMEICDNSRIDDFCVLSGKIKIGRNVHLAPFCLIAGGSEGVELDDFSGCAYHVQVFSQSDDYTGCSMTNPTVPEKYKNVLRKKVTIGKHVIIGASSIVLPGVEISEGCSVGAMSLITKNTEPWGVYFGIPAKRLKNRKKNLLELEKLYLVENRK